MPPAAAVIQGPANPVRRGPRRRLPFAFDLRPVRITLQFAADGSNPAQRRVIPGNRRRRRKERASCLMRSRTCSAALVLTLVPVQLLGCGVWLRRRRHRASPGWRFALRTGTRAGRRWGGGAGLSARALRARSTAHLWRAPWLSGAPKAPRPSLALRHPWAGDAPWWLPQGAGAQPRSGGGQPWPGGAHLRPFRTQPQGHKAGSAHERRPPCILLMVRRRLGPSGRCRRARRPAGRR